MKSTTIFISLEYISGLVFAILGMYTYSLFDTASLMASVFNTFISAFASILFGIGIIGFFHLRVLRRLNLFGVALLYSFLGLLSFIIVYLLINALTFGLVPYYLSSVALPILLPLSGAVMGFNLRIRK